MPGMPDAPATPAGEDEAPLATPGPGIEIELAPLPLASLEDASERESHESTAALEPADSPDPSIPPLLAQRERGPGGESTAALESTERGPSPFVAWGYPGAPVVLAIHDAGHDLRMWATLGERLADAYHLLAIDLPGHGAEEAPDFQWSLADAASSVIDALAAEQIEIAAIVGAGLGARIAVEVAAQQPTLVAALVLADLPLDTTAFADAGAIIERRGPGELGKRVAAGISDSFLRRAIHERYARLSRDGMLAAIRALVDAGPVEISSLAGMRAPVLVCSAQDHPSLVSCRSFARNLPAARHLTFRECESAALGRPGDFADQVFRFLRAVEEGDTISGERTI